MARFQHGSEQGSTLNREQKGRGVPIAVTIAGSDSSGGAGIEADLKTFSALGVYGAAVVTAVTAQNTKGVFGIHEVPAAFIAAQIDAVFSDLEVGAVKIGMLPGAAAIDAVAEALDRHRPSNVVLDPVMAASSGDRLLQADGTRLQLLLSRVRLLTPNLPEAAGYSMSRLPKTKTRCGRRGRSCWRKAPRRFSSKAAIAAAPRASICSSKPGVAFGLRRRAWRPKTPMAQVVRCRRQLPPASPRDCRWKPPPGKPRSTSARRSWLRIVSPSAPATGRCTIFTLGGRLSSRMENCYRFPPFRGNAAEVGTMRAILTFVAVMAVMMSINNASGAEYEMASRPDLVFAEHDGVKLVGDLYLPKGRTKAPVLVAIHGGGWQIGSRQFYRYWGLFLARAGYAVFAVEYRLGKQGTYPAAVYDVKAAIQFVRAKAAEFDLDPDRIGLVGDSAGAHLASLTALAGDQFNTAYRDDANAAVAADVKAVIGFYGVYDMHAQWMHDLTTRPNDKIVEKFLGVSPMQNRRVYFEASPISFATIDRNRVKFLLIYGTDDDIVDSPSQSGAFLVALTQAGFFVRRIIVPGAGHFWASDPFESEPHSYSALVIPRLMRFLDGSL